MVSQGLAILGLVEADIDRLAGAQHSLITTNQLIETGLSSEQIYRRVEQGLFIRVRPGVYRTAGGRPTWEQAVMAACLAAGTGVYASHRTAGRLWQTPFFPRDNIELLTAGSRPKLPGVRAHFSGLLEPSDTTRLLGIPVTSAARTVIDNADVPVEVLGPATDELIRRGELRLEDLRRTYERLAEHGGRRKLRPIESLLRIRLPGYEPGDSPQEARVARLLAKHGLPKPRMGYRVRIGGRTFLLDFAWPEFLVALEYDGWDWHKSRSSFDKDRSRWSLLAATGWLIIFATSATTDDEIVGRLTEAFAHRSVRSLGAGA